MNHGTLIKPRATDYIKGVNSPLVLKAVSNGDWTAYFPFNEFQRNLDFDNDGCAVYSTNKVLDAWMDFLMPTFPASVVSALQPFMDSNSTDGLPHFHSSPRFTENLTGNGVNGNSEGECYDVIRKYGAVPDTAFPFTETMTQAEYFTPPSEALLAQGQTFLVLMGGKNFLQYHFITNDSPKNIPQIQEALTQSPLNLGINVSDTGWNQTTPVDPPNAPPVHAVTAYKVVGETILISDNYVPYDKILDAGYPVNYVTQAIVTYIVPIEQQIVSDTANIVSEIPQSNATPAVKETLLQEVEDVVQEIETIL